MPKDKYSPTPSLKTLLSESESEPPIASSCCCCRSSATFSLSENKSQRYGSTTPAKYELARDFEHKQHLLPCGDIGRVVILVQLSACRR